MWLEKILGNKFVAVKNIQFLAKEIGMNKTELKRQKHILGVKTVQVESETGRKIWLWFLPHRVFAEYTNWVD